MKVVATQDVVCLRDEYKKYKEIKEQLKKRKQDLKETLYDGKIMTKNLSRMCLEDVAYYGMRKETIRQTRMEHSSSTKEYV